MKIGIVGYGKVGQYLVSKLRGREDFQLVFVWNRTASAFDGADDWVKSVVLPDLEDFASRGADIIVEVAHPCIVASHGARFLAAADFMVGSPTALADASLEAALRAQALSGPHGLYIPSGAMWGALDIEKMASLGSLTGLRVAMIKHPSSLKLVGPLAEALQQAADKPGRQILYEGPVRQLCPLAPNNVNTMAAAALAAHNLGFDKVIGMLACDTSLNEHLLEIEVTGSGNPPFTVSTVKHNPSKVGAVTGDATYGSFWSSTQRCGGRGPGVHSC